MRHSNKYFAPSFDQSRMHFSMAVLHLVRTILLRINNMNFQYLYFQLPTLTDINSRHFIGFVGKEYNSQLQKK